MSTLAPCLINGKLVVSEDRYLFLICALILDSWIFRGHPTSKSSFFRRILYNLSTFLLNRGLFLGTRLGQVIEALYNLSYAYLMRHESNASNQ